MADNIDIQIGGEVVRVPRWATEETAQEMMKYNAASAKALTAMLKLSDRNNKAVLDNQKIFQSMKNATKKDATETIKVERKLTDAKIKYGKVLKETSGKIITAGKDVSSAFNRESLAGVATGLAGLLTSFGLVGAAAGFTVSILENFSKNIAELSNVGIGLGISLVDLRQQAAQTGLNMEDYGKLVLSNGDALRSIGDNAQDGAKRFSYVAEEARHLSRQFNNFGMTTQEFNDTLLQEIEMRRKAGFSQADITNGVAQSMNNLMRETTAMATITGQDRRDMIRRRFEMMEDPALKAARMAAARDGMDMADSFSAISDSFGAGGDVGSKIGAAIFTAVSNELDFRAIDPGLAQIANLNLSVGSALTDIQEFVRNNRNTMDPREFRTQLVSMLAEVPELLTSQDMQQLSRFAATGVEGSDGLISLISELEGLTSDVKANRDMMNLSDVQLMNTALLALPTTMNELVNQIKASTLTTALEGLGVVFESLGADVSDSGQELVDALRGLSDNFGTDQNVFEGLKASYTDLTSTMDRLKHTALAAAGALLLMAGSSGVRRLISGAFGRGAVAATGGATAAATAAGGATAAKTGMFSKMLGAFGGFMARATPIAAGLTVGLGIKPTGDGTIPDSMRGIKPMSQEEINAEYNRIVKSQVPIFENLSPYEQTSRRSATPGSQGHIENMKAMGSIDAETHAILTGRYNGQSPTDMKSYFDRLATAMEENNRLMRRQTDAIENQ